MLKPTKNGVLRRISALFTLLFKERITNALIRLRRGAVWSAPLLFPSNKIGASRVDAHKMLKPRLPGLRLATRLLSQRLSH